MSESLPTMFAGNEVALLHRLRSGDDAAFAELVQTHGPRLLVVLKRYLPQDQD